MAGSASITPLVQRMIEDKFGPDRVMHRKRPKFCVAEGAAILANLLVNTVCHNCGHPYDEDAEECAECGAPLQLSDKVICRQCAFPNEPGAQVCAMCNNRLQIIVDGAFSSRHYGLQLAGDTFSVFIEKNDEIPTAEPGWKPFETQVPNQRMIRIPVYGGDNLEKASANENQGEFFAILPPGLPEGTVVRVSLSLDADEIFCPAGRLEDGTDLQPWVITGGADQKAIEAFNEVDRDLAQLATAFSQSAQEAIDKHKEQILKNLHDGAYQDAQRGIEQLRQLATAISSLCD